MGSFFNALFLRTDGAPKETRERLKAGFVARGYDLLPQSAGGEHRATLYADRKRAWGALVTDLLGGEDDLEEARRVARELGKPVILAMNVDSDALYLALTDGERMEDVVIGNGEAYDLRAETGPGPMWDEVLGSDANRAAFREVLGREYVFSEEALNDLAPLIGGLPDVAALSIELEDEVLEDGPRPYCSFNLGHKKGGTPFLAKRTAPPALVDQGFVSRECNENPFMVRCDSMGGEGRGVVVELRAVGYDPDALEMPFASVFHFGVREQLFAEKSCSFDEDEMCARCFFRCVPERQTFEDGSRGWIARLPEVPILRGVNPEHPDFQRARGQKARFNSGFCVYAAICGDAYSVIRKRPLSMPERFQTLPQYTRIRCYPMENPAGFTELEMGLVQYGDFSSPVLTGKCNWNWPDPMPEPYGVRHGRTIEELNQDLWSVFRKEARPN